jgi:hypothetical protein
MLFLNNLATHNIAHMEIDIKTFGAIFATNVLTGTVIYTIIKEIIIHKLKSKIDSDYARQLEIFKNEFSNTQLILSNIVSTQRDGYGVFNAARIKAIEAYWDYYLYLLNGVNPIAHLDSFITISEFEQSYENTKYRDKLYSAIHAYQEQDSISTNNGLVALKSHQPFFNSKMWDLITFFNTFCGRLTYLYQKSFTEKKFMHWTRDKPLFNLVKDALSEQEFDYLSTSKYNSINVVLAFLESKILSEIFLITSGKSGSDYSFEHARERSVEIEMKEN